MKKRTAFKRYNVIKISGILFLTLAMVWCVFSIKANAAEKAENDKVEYQLAEIQFKSQIRNCLNEQGYFNCGITMTKVMDTDGSRAYSVLVHHQDIDNADEVNAVYAVLMALEMEGNDETVNYTIF